MKDKRFSFFGRSVPKKYLWILAAIGVLLLLISWLIPSDEAKVAERSEDSAESYARSTEEKLTSILSDMLGSKGVRVMVTLDSSGETVYADTTKINTGLSENVGGDQKTRTEQSDSKENDYIILKDSNGNETALVVTKVMPQVRGVVVVCPNGNEEAVQAMVKSAVVTALNISSKKVCVVGSPT